MSIGRAAFGRDHLDVRRSDLVLMNLLRAERVSIGSITEVGWATAYGKPIVLVMEASGNPHDHLFVRQAAMTRLESLEEALEVVRAVLLP